MKALHGFAAAGQTVIGGSTDARSPLSQPVREDVARHRAPWRGTLRAVVLGGLAGVAIVSVLGALYVGLWFATAASVAPSAPSSEPPPYRGGEIVFPTQSECDGEPSSFRTLRTC